MPRLINKKDKLSEIIMAVRQPNIGLVVTPVELLGFHVAGSQVKMDGELWSCLITAHYWKVMQRDGELETMYGRSRVAFIPDPWMRPIKPPEADKAEKKGANTGAI
jgi:hypothetical protein